ncbi:Brefeldin A-inhibited guanine nucleotide-exchange protein 2 [Apostasia shenzhenica]|uniref:Brefeldin A-inhibited guanine nucleotide-exchange protein 2 n=1 Tax=Apostasia shenzhenica TaxID=1088818 RepID=A0A2I0B032_9ASPA|nr:Brefeldin A-inhibited guanine nucleotide-exchange protein 2 [Apostasia shenzhenica]
MASSSEDNTPLNQIVIPALEKIIKNASWRNGHSKLSNQCKSVIERLSSPASSDHPESPSSSSSAPGPVSDLSLAESEAVLSPLVDACSSSTLKVAEPALDCIQRLISHALLHGEADPSAGPSARLLSQLIEAACRCCSLSDESAELLLLKTLLSAVTSTSLGIHGDSLLLIVRTVYDLYLASKSPVNQTTAKASLIQMLVIVFRRMEADSSTVPVQPIVVADLIDPAADLIDGDVNQFVQGFITRIIGDIDGVFNPGSRLSAGGRERAFNATAVESTNPADLLDSTDKDMLDAKYWEISMYKMALEGRKDELGGEGLAVTVDRDDDDEAQIANKLRRDAFLVFRALCKLSMKSPTKEALAVPSQMKGKIVSLELLKILLENAGAVFRTSEKFLGAIKQYLCLSLLKNCASPLMIVFQLSCSIFMSLVSRFRPGLKAEIGVFFPMIVLRVLENVSQPNFQQKIIVLRFIEKLCIDSQILVDIFVNYDCDVHSPNIFERLVNCLLKTAQGAPPGVSTTFAPPQDSVMKLEAKECLVAILKSMGEWINKQMRVPDLSSPRSTVMPPNNTENMGELPIPNGAAHEHAKGMDNQITNGGASESESLEQHGEYKLNLQEGISLFNRKPREGIQFLINANKVGDSPEEIAVFLKTTSGLNKFLIGDYLGERKELPLKVMQAYVDSFDFQGMEIDEALRTFLQGFRLLGEAQKIDCIVEKFGERYCRCNPKAFASADTAYILAYSIIMLDIDARSPMMSADDFIRNNSGINDGKDLPEEYLRSLHVRISKNQMMMNEDDLSLQSQQFLYSKKILGFGNILNIVVPKQGDEAMDASEGFTRHMHEQFNEKPQKSESVYNAATDVVILRYMMEVCWAPMLAAFSVALDQSDDLEVTSVCLEGFRYAVHVTSVMSMKTQRDAFVTSLAKFTSLHSAADIKQKNIDAIKVYKYGKPNQFGSANQNRLNPTDASAIYFCLMAIILIADDDGNYLQEAWEHVLTCVSRLEHLHLLGEGAPSDATFFAIQQKEFDRPKQAKSILPALKKKGPGRLQQAAAAARRGSYDSAGVGGHASGVVTSEQMKILVSNLNLLEQVGMMEINLIFVRCQKLNSEAIIDFVKALCKVSKEELWSTSEPRVFSLTKIVEIAHYNMNRIRLVWSSIWNVLSDFFVTIGCSENLSIAIFAMDSLRQLAMKFFDRKELANYNFQNQFMKPFVIVMRKSRAVEIRELVIRCVSQMVFSRVKNVKSGWKSTFMVLTTASYDEHKNIVFLAFEILEKIIKDCFPYITDIETTAFTDCVNCLIAFTNSRFSKDVSLQAISLLQFGATKLAEGDFSSRSNSAKENFKDVSANTNKPCLGKDKPYNLKSSEMDDHLLLWFPLLAGLSELTFDLRAEIRKSALQVLFDTLSNHGHLFSVLLWDRVFDSVLFPLFDYVRQAIDPSGEDMQDEGFINNSHDPDQDGWLYETCTLALQLVIDLFVRFYDTVNPLLRKVLVLLISFIKRTHQSLAGIGITAFTRLISSAGTLFAEEKWLDVVLSLKEAATATVPNFSLISSDTLLADLVKNKMQNSADLVSEEFGRSTSQENFEEQRARILYFALVDIKCRVAVQLLLIQAVTEISSMFRGQLSPKNTIVLFESLHNVATHAHKINTDSELRSKLLDLGPMTQMQDPPLLRLENESYLICLNLLQNAVDNHSCAGKAEEFSLLVNLCRETLQVYVDIAKVGQPAPSDKQRSARRQIPMGSSKRRELAARAPVVVATLQAICGLEKPSFKKNLAYFFPLLSNLISCEHGSGEVQEVLSDMLASKNQLRVAILLPGAAPSLSGRRRRGTLTATTAGDSPADLAIRIPTKSDLAIVHMVGISPLIFYLQVAPLSPAIPAAVAIKPYLIPQPFSICYSAPLLPIFHRRPADGTEGELRSNGDGPDGRRPVALNEIKVVLRLPK